MKYKLAIFDFDGTLADSFPFFIQVFNQLAQKHGFREIDADAVPGLRQKSARQIMQVVELPKWKLPFVAKDFASLMKNNAASISLFEHIESTLLHLANNGVALAVVSSNAYDNIREILGADMMKIITHFECGMSIFGKSPRIRKVLKEAGVSCHEAIYIGDQISDLDAARKEKVAFGAVSWGYGAIESLRGHSPEEEFENVLSMRRIVPHSYTDSSTAAVA